MTRSLIRKLFQVVEAIERASLLKYLHVLHLSVSACRRDATPPFGLVRRRCDEERTRNGWRELGFPGDMWPAFLDGVSIRCQSTAATNFHRKAPLPTFNAPPRDTRFFYVLRVKKCRNAQERVFPTARNYVRYVMGNPMDSSFELLILEPWPKNWLSQFFSPEQFANKTIFSCMYIFLVNFFFANLSFE